MLLFMFICKGVLWLLCNLSSCNRRLFVLVSRCETCLRVSITATPILIYKQPPRALPSLLDWRARHIGQVVSLLAAPPLFVLAILYTSSIFDSASYCSFRMIRSILRYVRNHSFPILSGLLSIICQFCWLVFLPFLFLIFKS